MTDGRDPREPIVPRVDPVAPAEVLEELSAAFSDDIGRRAAHDDPIDDVEPTFDVRSPADAASGPPTAAWPAPSTAIVDANGPAPDGPEPAIEPTIDWLGEPIFADGANPSRHEVIEVDLDDTSTEISIEPTVPIREVPDPSLPAAHAAAPDAAPAGAPVAGSSRRTGRRRRRTSAPPIDEFADEPTVRVLGRGEVPERPDPLPAAGGARATIVIGGDDLPDAMYLDEANELRLHQMHGQGDRTAGNDVVVIGDVDDVDFSLTDAPSLPTGRGGQIDPRVRARRVAVRRAAGRRRLFWVSLVGGLLLVLVIAGGVVASPVFGVEEVVVQGAVYTDPEVLDSIITDLQGDAVLLVDELAIERRLEAVPWVERARVQARFPHQVVIDIRERRALAAFQGGDLRWRVIDVQGRVLDVLDGQPVAYMPITGTHPDTARGQFAGAPYAAVAELVQVLPAEVRAVTRSIGLDAVSGTLTMQLTTGTAVRLGSADELDLKLARLLGQVRGGLDGVVALDVSTAQIGVVVE